MLALFIWTLGATGAVIQTFYPMRVLTFVPRPLPSRQHRGALASEGSMGGVNLLFPLNLYSFSNHFNLSATELPGPNGNLSKRGHFLQ